MKNKRIKIIIVSILTLFILTGCQLAIEDMGEQANGDRLIGVYITKEYLDLFNTEGYLNENISQVMNGGILKIEGNTEQYQGRIYAQIEEEKISSSEGEEITWKKYVFQDLKGLEFLAPKIVDEQGSYLSFYGAKELSDQHMGSAHGDHEDKITLEATIYQSVEKMETPLYANPVYQGADGLVYAMSGSGSAYSGFEGEGNAHSITLEEETFITETDQNHSTDTIKKASTSITIHMVSMYEPTLIQILQMDKNNIVVSKEVYQPGFVPEELKVKPEIDYIIVETSKKDEEGSTIKTREIFSEKDEFFSTFSSGEKDIYFKKETKIMW